MLLIRTPPCFSTISYCSVEIRNHPYWCRRTSHLMQSECTVVRSCICSSKEGRKDSCRMLKKKPQTNLLQKEVIINLHVCVEECRHYPRSHLQLLNILHSLSQGQSSILMSTATKWAIHMIIYHINGYRR